MARETITNFKNNKNNNMKFNNLINKVLQIISEISSEKSGLKRSVINHHLMVRNHFLKEEEKERR